MQKPLTNDDEKQGPPSERPCHLQWNPAVLGEKRHCLSRQQVSFRTKKKKGLMCLDAARHPPQPCWGQPKASASLWHRGKPELQNGRQGCQKDGSGDTLSGSSFALSLCALREHLFSRAATELTKLGTKATSNHLSTQQCPTIGRRVSTLPHMALQPLPRTWKTQ